MTQYKKQCEEWMEQCEAQEYDKFECGEVILHAESFLISKLEGQRKKFKEMIPEKRDESGRGLDGWFLRGWNKCRQEILDKLNNL